MRSIAILGVLAVGLPALGARSAMADELRVDIRNARPGKTIEVSIRSAEANGAILELVAG